jgi:hypothetical protein
MNQGIMPSPNLKLCKNFRITIKVVRSSCNSDAVRAVMPGKKNITYELKTVMSKYIKRNNCCCVI